MFFWRVFEFTSRVSLFICEHWKFTCFFWFHFWSSFFQSWSFSDRLLAIRGIWKGDFACFQLWCERRTERGAFMICWEMGLEIRRGNANPLRRHKVVCLWPHFHFTDKRRRLKNCVVSSSLSPSLPLPFYERISMRLCRNRCNLCLKSALIIKPKNVSITHIRFAFTVKPSHVLCKSFRYLFLPNNESCANVVSGGIRRLLRASKVVICRQRLLFLSSCFLAFSKKHFKQNCPAFVRDIGKLHGR